MVEKTSNATHAAYENVHDDPRFAELKRRYLRFVVPTTIAFLVWYLTFVVMSNWATGFMDTRIVGNINVALVFGLLQFVSTFGIAYLYSRYANKRLDPVSGELLAKFDGEKGDDR